MAKEMENKMQYEFHSQEGSLTKLTSQFLLYEKSSTACLRSSNLIPAAFTSDAFCSYSLPYPFP